MAKFVKFTNASPNFEGEDIYINAEVVSSVFYAIGEKHGRLNPRTVLYGVNNVDWFVKETLEETVKLLND